MTDRPPQLFLLSPAYCGGRRATMLLRANSSLALAAKFDVGTLTLGDAFAFLSGLYFRGKLAYARAFAHGAGEIATHVITPTRGLLPPETVVTRNCLREFATIDLASATPAFRDPLERDVAALACRLPSDARVVLLGSIATSKYIEILSARLGPRLYYPRAFIGRGDMSRGGLLLRSASSGVELEYAVIDPAERRHGPRPPKLEPLPRR